MGLGSWPAVSLAEARKERDKWAQVARGGSDPIEARRAAAADAKAAMDRKDPTFAEMTQIAFDAKRAGLRGDGKRGRWLSPLTLHMVPKLGAKRMSEIHQTDIKDALAPIWRKMPPTAEKTIERTRVVFETARLSGIDCDPFTVDAARHMLGVVKHVPKHHASLPWQDAPALFHDLGSHPSHMCIKWLMMTVVRSHAGRGARYSEIEGNTWTVPPERVKGNEGDVQPFRVPLPQAALDLVEALPRFDSDLLFQSPKKGSTISDVALTKVLRKKAGDATIHGMRTTFRTWAQDTGQPWDVAETVLGHSIGGKVERSYARSDLLDRRRVVMEKWAAHVTGQAADVVQLRGGNVS